MSNGESTTSVCPCGTVIFPQAICNLPDLPAIAYRIGDFVAFRYELLQALPGETELTLWRPNVEGDLALQMVEWWAYLGDILTFYNERIANESYLHTALLPESVNHLVQLLGYRPKPALGAKGTLAALLTPSAQLPLTLPAGLQIQSKPGPGQSPQIFELDSPTTIGEPDVVSADVDPADGHRPLLDSTQSTLWLAGKVSGIKAGDRYLLINAAALTTQTIEDYAWIKVTTSAPGTDPLGNAITQVSFATISGTIAGNAQAANYVLLRSQQSSPLWGYKTTTAQVVATTDGEAETIMILASVARAVTPGALLLLDVSDAATSGAGAAKLFADAFSSNLDAEALAKTIETSSAQAASIASAFKAGSIVSQFAQAFKSASATVTKVEFSTPKFESDSAFKLASGSFLTAAGFAAELATVVPTPVIVQSYSEVVWYANGDGPQPPPPASPPVSPIGMPVAQIGFASFDDTGSWAATWNDNVTQVTVRWGWTQVGQPVPVLTAADLTYTGGNTVLVPAPGAASFPTLPAAALLEDGNGNAAAATASAAPNVAGGAVLGNIAPPPPLSLVSPIDVYFDRIGVSRGKSVPSEVLGSGNPTVAGQDFTLTQSPVTYFFDPASISGNNFSSTVQVSVNGVQWQEVQSFYGQPPNAQVFVLYEDDQQNTHVTFGDGINGALLPTGTNNIVATYRYGAGAVAPTANTLTVVLTPTPGLKGVANPLPPTGGGDADQPAQLRSLAPQSVLTFNRAVSLDDYEAIALTASGVTQAVASFSFDPSAQRPVVTLWIAGDSGAAAAVTTALTAIAVPNQSLRVYQATPVPATLSLTYVRDPRYGDAAIQGALTTALVDPNVGLLGTNVVGIGQSIYQSQIAAACLAVPGVTAIQNVVLATVDGITIAPTSLSLVRRFLPPPVGRPNCSGQSYNPGAGKYFSIPNDGQHLFLTGTVAS